MKYVALTMLVMTAGLVIFIAMTPAPPNWLHAKRKCTNDELFYNPNSPTFLQAGQSLFAVGKYTCSR